MVKSYQKLCTEFYDLTKPEAGPREVAFYEKFIKKSRGPVLEAMCGSGRLLIPLLKKGCVIDGVDNSKEMLASCAKRCKEAGLSVNLFNLSLQDLSLPMKYGLIFIAVGSFQLIVDRAEALQALKKLRTHLLPGGTLLIETFIPWDTLRDSIQEGSISPRTRAVFEKSVSAPEGLAIVHKGATDAFPVEQFEVSESRYEKTKNGKVLAAEEEHLSVRWYYRYEMELFLEKAGFIETSIWDESFELNPQAMVYESRID